MIKDITTMLEKMLPEDDESRGLCFCVMAIVLGIAACITIGVTLDTILDTVKCSISPETCMENCVEAMKKIRG